jgi:SulP family sulfate permease
MGDEEPLVRLRAEPGWKRALPLAGVLRGYRSEWLRGDLAGGVSACVVMIPSVIAYADLLGLPPASGLYAALAGVLGYALFASSRQVIAGPDAAIALLVASGVGPLAGGDPARAAALSAATALLGGALMLIASRLRVGVVADFLSKPVLVGYMSGAALILVSTQLGKLFGLKLREQDFFPLLAELWGRLGQTHLPTLGLGLGLIALLVVLTRLAPGVPGALVVFVVALAASAAFDLQARGVKVVGDVPRGLPGFALPAVSRADLRDLFPAAVGIALLTFPDGILLARAFAAKRRYDVDPDQELRALAAANLAAGLFQGFSVGASQSRTTVNDATGGRTQVSSLMAAWALLLFLLFLTPLVRLLPAAALGAILVFAGVQLVEIREYVRLYRIARRGFFVAVLVTASVLVVGVVPGILVGVMLSLVVLLARLARPTDAVLQEVPGTGRFHDLGDASATETVPGLVAYRFYAPLFFANAQHFVERVRGLVAAGRGRVRWFLVDVQAVTEIDVTAAEMLARLAEELGARGVALKFARANRPLRERLAQVGLGEHLLEATLFASVHAAIEEFRRQAWPPPPAVPNRA